MKKTMCVSVCAVCSATFLQNACVQEERNGCLFDPECRMSVESPSRSPSLSLDCKRSASNTYSRANFHRILFEHLHIWIICPHKFLFVFLCCCRRAKRRKWGWMSIFFCLSIFPPFGWLIFLPIDWMFHTLNYAQTMHFLPLGFWHRNTRFFGE